MTILRQVLITVIAALLVVLTTSNPPVIALDTANGAKIFSVNCAACHPKGGNIIRRGKTLKKSALHRNKLDTLESVSYLVANGKNNMPAYQDTLDEQAIESVAAYVLEQAEKDWQ